MSPEQAMGEKSIDARSDIYALGAVTYEMLLGDAPFTGSSVQAIVAKVLNERPTSLHTLRDAVPPAVEHAVFTALAKLAADRFATAKEFSDALEGQAAGATRATAYGESGARAVRSRSRDALVMGFAALFVAATGIALWQWTVAHRAPPVEIIRYAIELPRYVSDGATRGSSVAISPDGRTVVYVGGAAEGSSQQLFIRTANDVHPRPVPGTEAALGVFLSPDGKWLGFWRNGRLRQ